MKRPLFSRLVFGLALALFLLVGCDRQSPGLSGRAVKTVSLTLQDLNGKEYRLEDYRGKWVVVNYWATWCPPCLGEIPELELFHREHKDRDAVVWGVNREEISLDDLKAFVAEQGINYPVFHVSPDAASELGVIPGIPTTFLVSPSGELAARHVGAIDAKGLEAFIGGGGQYY